MIPVVGLYFFGNYNLTGVFLSIEKTTDEKARFWWNASPDIKPSNAIIPVNTWTHLVITRQGNTVKFYINGTLTDTSTTTLDGTVPTTATNFRLGRDGRSGATSFNGSMNDFRLYNHALSPKEVELLARGLVVHYKMNGDGRGQANLYDFETVASKWANDGMTSLSTYSDAIYGNVLKFTNTSANVRIYRSVSNVWTTATKYTVSFMARAATEGTIINMSRSIADFSPNFTLSTDWKYYSGQISNTKSTTGGTLSVRTVSGTGEVYLANVKVEIGGIATPYIPGVGDSHYTSMGYNDNIEYAVSGYNYHGANLGTFTYDSDTPRYSVSTTFDGTSAINCGNSYNVQGAKNMTISLWAYLPDWTISTKQVFISSQQSCGFYIQRGSGTSVSFRCNYYNAEDLSSHTYSTITYACTLTGWHMLTATYDTSAIRLYLDGVQVTSASLSGSYGVYFNPATSVKTYIGAEATASSYETPVTSGCKISDVRIYYTTLIATQVAELYNTSASISNNGTLMAYEFIEQ